MKLLVAIVFFVRYSQANIFNSYCIRLISAGDYDLCCEQAAEKAEKMLAQVGGELTSNLLELFPAVIWEDHDDCLQVRPEDIGC